jgi:hypothetical protein
MADQDQQQQQPAVPSIDDYGRTLSAGYSHDEIRSSIEKDSGLSGDDLNAEYAKLQAATTVRPEPGTTPPPPRGDSGGIPASPEPVPGTYTPEKEQEAMRRADQIPDPEERLHVQTRLKQMFANDRIMDGVTQATREKNLKTSVGQYSKAVEEIRDDPHASLQQKQAIIKQLTQTMWNDPRLQYGETQGQLEDYMQKLAFGEDAEKLGNKYTDAVHGVVTGQIKSPQQLLEMYDRGDLTWSGLQKSFAVFEHKDKPEQAAIHQRVDFANQQIKNAVLKGTDESGVYGEKPTPKMYEKLTDTLQALNSAWLAAGGDQEKIAKLTSHEAVQELIERVYPLYERNADRVLGGAKAFANIAVPQTVSADERSQTAYRDIVGLPPTITNPKSGKPEALDIATWQDRVGRLLARPTPENIADFTKKYGQDGAYIVRSIRLGPGPEPTPAVQPAVESFPKPAASAAPPRTLGEDWRAIRSDIYDIFHGGKKAAPTQEAAPPARPPSVGPNVALEE